MTFLFTDIEGSTRRWEADAEAMRTALETHNEVLRAMVAAHGGTVFNYTGDGMCAVFASPRSAVDAAVAAQPVLELPVRMGIATGEAELRGGDYFGTVLNRTARVMAAGHGGQILIDGATAGLVSDVELADFGPRRLRDIGRPVELFQVRAPGLRSDFPPLKTVDPTPGNLRPPTTSLIGREAELAEVQTAVKGHRLVTLIGVGGVGKTRLALEVAALSADGFIDGVWVIELAAVSDPAAVPEAVAAVLGITRQPGLTLADSVAAALEGRSRLLIFDNCEHVLDAAADMIEAILTASSTVKVLATSREGLRVADEQLWPVPSLDVHSSAAMLFVDRAHAVAPGISLTEAGDTVVEICRRLDGIPLAIELAASRMQSMAVTELKDRLDDRFRLLVGSRRGLERHQTLRHAVQWSYDLLDDAEKALLAGCSVFAGGFDLAGACAVTSSSDEIAILDLLDALVRKSLLAADSATGRTRFSMLETIRQFAEEQLVASGGADAARDAHARFFAGRAEEVAALWDGPRQRQTYAWFTVELANLRAAFRWAADNHELDTAAAIAVYATFLGCWVVQREPIGWAEELIEAAAAAEHRRLAQLYVMATQCYVSGRLDDALRYADAGLSLIESGRSDAVPHEFEVSIGGAYIFDGHPERWVALCRAVIERQPKTHLYIAAVLTYALTMAGAGDEALAASTGLLAATDATDNPHAACFALLAYGSAVLNRHPVAAYDAFLRGLAIAADNGDRQIEAHLAVAMARLCVIHRDPAEAFDFVSLAVRNHYDSGSFPMMAGPLAVLIACLERLGHHQAAATACGFIPNPLARAVYPEIDASITRLRERLGDVVYQTLTAVGAQMTNAAMVTYALDQIASARAELPLAGESL